MKDIISINIADKLAILNNDEIISITSITEHPILPDIYICVAGPCSDRKWYVFSSDDFQKVTIQ